MKKLICTCIGVFFLVALIAGCELLSSPGTSINPESSPKDSPSPEVSVSPESSPEASPATETQKDVETVPDPPPSIAASGGDDFSEAGLPSEAVLFPDAQWNDFGYFKARAIAYVDAVVDPDRLPDNWPEVNKFYGIFFQAECKELLKGYTEVSGFDFDFCGPGAQRMSGNVKPSGDIRSSWSPKAIGDIGYVSVLVTAEKLEDITHGWYQYSIKNEQTDSYDKYLHYISSMPFGSLTIRERPSDFDYSIPLSAVVSVGEWSESSDDPTLKLRTLAYDEYPMRDSDKPDFMYPEEKMFYVYFEAENTGTETLSYTSVFTKFKGTGVKDGITMFFSPKYTLYDTSLPHLEPGERDVFYKIVAAKSMSDVQTITFSLKDDVAVPFSF